MPIRVVALALVRRPGTRQILVFESADPDRRLRFRRPPGGGVDFGERSELAVVRELAEEFGVTGVTLGVAGVFEEIFSMKGERHEVLIVHEVRLEPPSLYDLDVLPDIEFDEEPGIWHDLDDPPPGVALFPVGIEALVR